MDTKDAIRALRMEKGLSQDELAERVFVTRQAVSRWETGVEELKTAIAGYDLPSVMIYSTVDMLGLSREETGQYFHELLGE